MNRLSYGESVKQPDVISCERLRRLLQACARARWPAPRHVLQLLSSPKGRGRAQDCEAEHRPLGGCARDRGKGCDVLGGGCISTQLSGPESRLSFCYRNPKEHTSSGHLRLLLAVACDATSRLSNQPGEATAAGAPPCGQEGTRHQVEEARPGRLGSKQPIRSLGCHPATLQPLRRRTWGRARAGVLWSWLPGRRLPE